MPNKDKTTTTLPPDHTQRRRILEELDRTMLVEAAAGTGKTTSMIGRMVALIREGRCKVDTMAAITFTRKAAAELRARFQIELERAAGEADGDAGERLAEAVAHIQRCFIGTIHSFCGRLLRERPIEAGIDLAFQEMEDDEDGLLREEVWDDYVERLNVEGAEVIDQLRELGLEIDQLRNSFISFANYPDVDEWPVEEVHLGDLSGIREEIDDYVRHMERLIPTFPVDRGTDRLMSTYERIVRLVRNRDLDKTSDLMEVLDAFNSSSKATQKCWPEGSAQGKAEKDRWELFAANSAGPVLQRWLEKRYAMVIQVLLGAVRVYDLYRARRGALNFQDLLMRASWLLHDKPQVRRYFRARFTHLLVDEFQDTDPVQAEVMMYLTASDPNERDWRRCRPEPGSLFVVGDPKQSIYRFRRADIVTYNQVKQIIDESGGSIVSLTSNFRTLGELVWWSNHVFVNTFPAEATPYSPASRTMQIGRQDGTEGELSGIRVIEVPEDLSKKENAVEFDADLIARYIRHALDTKMTVPRSRKECDHGVPPEVSPGDFMIVTRNRGQLAHYSRKLQELGIPHQVSGGSALGQVGELKLLIDCLRAVAEPENTVALLAALRGELFGLSDADLYAYKRAGGRFSYRSDPPEELEDEISRLYTEAFTRLRRYNTWLKRMPTVPAIERIAADLGLPVRALAQAGGDVQAGSIAKVFQMIRAASTERHSVSDLAQYLAELIERNAEFDGIPVQAHTKPVVRLMNLHRAKGLEAPIVFLANPTGKGRHGVRLHIDRSGDKIRGYMGIYEDTGGYNASLLACPTHWEDHQEEEERFEEAEAKRLLYVAATRAGAQLVITRKLKRSYDSYWEYFTEYINDCELLPDPGEQMAPSGRQVRIDGEDVERATADIADGWKPVTVPTYRRGAAKELSVASVPSYPPVSSGEYGTEWGTVIHTLLETAMRDPGADLHQIAYAVVKEQGLEASYVTGAVQTVESVMKSEIWARAAASEKVLAEVPFTICRSAGESGRELPTIIRGAIDLVFREAAGWVIVDYKSDAAAADSLDDLVEHYRGQIVTYLEAWQEITGEPVKEAGLYFTRVGEYVVV